MKRRRPSRLIAALILCVILAVSTVWLALNLPYRGFANETYVRFDKGSGARSIAQALEKSGVIRYAWQFRLARALTPFDTLVAGEYRFTDSASVREVLRRIARGDVYFIELSVPEGSNMFDIARIAASAGVMTVSDFLRAAQDPSKIRDLDPAAPSLEGYLFPATYRVFHSTTPDELCDMMTHQFRRHWQRLTGVGQHADPHNVLTLASMVEKETSLAAERPLIAGVFTNRLRMNMRLECDPTTIYAALMDDRYRGVIHRSDLASRNPYNTYQNAGLPPGPIANPGADALAAALHPAQTDYLYFVAKPSGGGHQFSSTLAEHDKAVRAYRHEHAAPAAKSASKNPKKA